MSILFDLEALATGGGLDAIQNGQRDFSPYLMHLTSHKAMAPVRAALGRASRRGSPGLVDLLRRADTASLRTLNQILKSGEIRASKFHEDFPVAVCLTECTLPGVLSHASRYGRYGLIFRKQDILALGGRPVANVTREHLDRMRNHATTTDDQEDLLYTNLYRPGAVSAPVQDYTHEREWRSPANIPTSRAVGVIIAAPEKAAAVGKYATNLPVLPLRLLYQLGV